MASGTIDLGTVGYLQGRITWSSSSNGTAKNSSQVTGTLQARRTNSYTTTGTWKGSLRLGSTTKEYSVYSGITSSWVTLCSFTITQAHSSDGSGTCYIYGQIKGPTGTSMANTTITGNKTVTLDKIARLATITAAPNFNDEGNPTITYTNPAGNSVTKLQACISLTGAKSDVAYRDISKTGTSYTFNLTEAERNVLRNATTDSNSRTVRFFVATTISGKVYHSSLTKTFTVINCAPTLSPTIEDGGSDSKVLTGDPQNKVIKYFNSMKVATGATALKGASIKSQSITCGTKRITTASGTLGYVESGTFVFSATDSRGNTTTKTVTKTLINYVKPTCNLDIDAPSPTGELSFNIVGNYFNGSFGAVDNELTLEYRYKTNDGEYGDWIPVTPTFTGNTYSAPVALTDLDYRSSYTFQAKASDVVGRYDVTTDERTVKTAPIFDWGKDDFRVNGDFAVTGGITPIVIPDDADLNDDEYKKPNKYVGKATADYEARHCPLSSGTFALDVTAGGNQGQVIQTLTYTSKEYFTIWTRFCYGEAGWNDWTKTYSAAGKMLWSGSWYMHKDQVITLPQTVTSQPNGICLVFSKYDIENSAPVNEQWTVHNVPKYMIANHPSGGGYGFFICTPFAVACKYLYITDTTITGNENNNKAELVVNGLTCANTRYVLRYVIGV